MDDLFTVFVVGELQGLGDLSAADGLTADQAQLLLLKHLFIEPIFLIMVPSLVQLTHALFFLFLASGKFERDSNLLLNELLVAVDIRLRFEVFPRLLAVCEVNNLLVWRVVREPARAFLRKVRLESRNVTPANARGGLVLKYAQWFCFLLFYPVDLSLFRKA